jgi:hypothetical protein
MLGALVITGVSLDVSCAIMGWSDESPRPEHRTCAAIRARLGPERAGRWWASPLGAKKIL